MTDEERRAEIDAYFLAMGIDNAQAIDRLTRWPGGYHSLHDIVAYPPMLRDWLGMGFHLEERRTLVVRLPCSVDREGIEVRFMIEENERLQAVAKQQEIILEQLRAEYARLQCAKKKKKRGAGKNKRES